MDHALSITHTCERPPSPNHQASSQRTRHDTRNSPNSLITTLQHHDPTKRLRHSSRLHDYGTQHPTSTTSAKSAARTPVSLYVRSTTNPGLSGLTIFGLARRRGKHCRVTKAAEYARAIGLRGLCTPDLEGFSRTSLAVVGPAGRARAMTANGSTMVVTKVPEHANRTELGKRSPPHAAVPRWT